VIRDRSRRARTLSRATARDARGSRASVARAKPERLPLLVVQLDSGWRVDRAGVRADTVAHVASTSMRSSRAFELYHALSKRDERRQRPLLGDKPRTPCAAALTPSPDDQDDGHTVKMLPPDNPAG